MESNIRISIIIPVYNAENYIGCCLDSIINQTFQEIEIICVDDGSTDNSLSIIKEYSNKDKRIKVLHQENKGASIARNNGINNSNGKYIIFVDSDDWLNEKALEKLFNHAEKTKSEMVIFKFINVDESSKEEYFSEFSDLEVFNSSFDNIIFNYLDVLDIIFKIPHSPFNKLYDAYFLKKNHLKFLEGYGYEDPLFFIDSFLEANYVSILREPLYYYRQREDSTSADIGSEFSDIFHIMACIKSTINKKGIYDKVKQQLFLYFIVNFKFVYKRLHKEYRDDFFNKLTDFYEKYDLNQVEVASLKKWHFDDMVFYQSISKSNNGTEFELVYKKLYYEFLANYYEQLTTELRKENVRLSKENKELINNTSSLKKAIKKIF